MEQESTVDLYLPEVCIANILSRTSARDACRFSVVSSVFQFVVNSDSVWERFLPSDYQQILSSSVSPFPFVFSSKKELYFHLCDNPVLIDNGTKTFALDKCSGKKCYMIGAKELSICAIYNPMGWIWQSSSESRFSEVVESRMLGRLEVSGRMETQLLSPNTTYVAYLVIKFTDSASGFDYTLAKVSVKLASNGGGEREMRVVSLKPVGRQKRQLELVHRRIADFLRRLRPPDAADQQLPPPQYPQVPRERGDGWFEIELGEFFNEKGEDGDVEMSLMEINVRGHKCGLIIQGIELRPKKVE
ncbi:hypothetical protein NE237_031803 [Protea cynaroides]|uniref:F-box domain-containing protein n=1 Tax=Protea cynaroides TaxID=273540 RepID=A0A9Q0L2A4_9MAGN|nr:hypothetical protein NE237_031803 [Protea cynaroides]